MSAASPPIDQSQIGPLPIKQWQRWSLVGGCAALLLCGIGALAGSPGQFFRAYLAAYMFFLGVALGSMALLMLYHLTGGAWGYVVRRLLEAQMRTLPLLALLFIPVGLGVEHLYLWSQPRVVASDANLNSQTFYFNRDFFWLRAVVYFAVWLSFAWLLSARSRTQDRTGSPRLPWKFQRLSEIGLVLYGTTLHFAAFDWIESLQPEFHSTIFPMLVASGQLLSAQAFVLVALIGLSWRANRATRDVASVKVLNDLGNILLAFLIIWAYMSWFQFMLCWIANLPSDALWYEPRVNGGWRVVTWAISILQFAIPLFLLLVRAVKCNPRRIASVAALIFFMHLVFTDYLVLPSFPVTGFSQHWMDFLMPVGLGGLWLTFFFDRVKRWPLLPLHDPNRENALHYRAIDDEDAAREQVLAQTEMTN